MKKILILGIGSLCMMAADASVIAPVSNNQTPQAPQNAVVATAPTMLDSIKFREEDQRLVDIIRSDNDDALLREVSDSDANMSFVTTLDSYLFSNTSIPMIHYAAMCGADKCVRALINSGANPNVFVVFRPNSNSQAIDINFNCQAVAVFSQNFEIIEMLQDQGMDIYNNPGAWFAAALANDIAAFHYLWASSPIQDGSEYQCLEAALIGMMVGNHPERLDILIQSPAWRTLMQNAGPNELHLNDLLFVAAKYDQDKIAAGLIAKGANVNSRSRYGTPMHWVARYDSPKVLKLLINEGSNIDITDWMNNTPLHYAAKYDSEKVGSILVSRRSNTHFLSADGLCPLHVAVQHDSKRVALLLLDDGEDVNVKGSFNETPLHIAAKYNREKLGKILIERGGNLEAPDREGRTPLHYAAEHNSREMGELLLNNDVNINAKDMGGFTPLHVAVDRNSMDMVELLVNFKADINATMNGGETPLHFASIFNRSQSAEILISKGAYINARDNNGKTPLSYAKQNNSQEMIHLLLQHGATE